jgi:hypothetical protein
MNVVVWGIKSSTLCHSKIKFPTDFCISKSKVCFPSQFGLFQPSNTLGFHYCALHERRSKTQWTINSGRGLKKHSGRAIYPHSFPNSILHSHLRYAIANNRERPVSISLGRKSCRE